MMAFSSRRLISAVSLILSLALYLVESAEMPRRRRVKNRQQAQRDTEWSLSHSHGLELIVLLLCIALLPPIISFCYNVARDPATPTVLRNASEVISQRTMGYLSARGGKAKTPRNSAASTKKTE